MSRKYFGTDGIRGRVGEFPITPDFVLKLGWAVGMAFRRQGTVSYTHLFQGEGFDQYHKQAREMFDKVQMRKPLSSRDRSREQYLLARGFRGE